MKVTKEEILKVIDELDYFAYEYGEMSWDCEVVVNKYELLNEIEKLFEDENDK